MLFEVDCESDPMTVHYKTADGQDWYVGTMASNEHFVEHIEPAEQGEPEVVTAVEPITPKNSEVIVQLMDAGVTAAELIQMKRNGLL